MPSGFERRVKRLHDRVIANQKKAEEQGRKQLMADLDEKSIKYGKKATKAELLELLKNGDQVDTE